MNWVKEARVEDCRFLGCSVSMVQGGVLVALVVVKVVSSWPGQECSHPLEKSHRDFTPRGNSIPQVESLSITCGSLKGGVEGSSPRYTHTDIPMRTKWRNSNVYFLSCSLFSVFRNVQNPGVCLPLYFWLGGGGVLLLAQMEANTDDSFLPHSKHCSAT